MDAEERLTLEAVREPTLMSAHHLHRYRLASRLCAGARVVDLACGVGYGSEIVAEGDAAGVLGVDLDAEAVRQANEAFGSDRVSFESADAIEFLRRLDPGTADVVVAFEALEHLDRLDEALDLLAELAEAGVRLLLSVPNSHMFRERNDFHLTDFDLERARTAFARFPDAHFLFQHIAEGSVICGTGERFEGRVEALDRGEPEYANSFVVAVGFPPGDVAAVTAQLNVVVAPNHNRYMLELEKGNTELRRANLRLTRQWLGRSDAAAASVLSRHERDRRELEEENEGLRRKHAEAEQTAKMYHEMYAREAAWRDASRYKAVDKVRDAAVGVPLAGPAARWLWKRASRR